MISASWINLGGSKVWFFGVSVHFSSISHIHQHITEGHPGHQLLPDQSTGGAYLIYKKVEEAGLGVETDDLRSFFLNP